MIRAASLTEVPLCAIAIQLAERAHRPSGIGLYDYIYPAPMTLPVLEEWARTPQTLFYYGNFLLSLDDAGVCPVAACTACMYGQAGFDHWDEVESTILAKVGFHDPVERADLEQRWKVVLRALFTESVPQDPHKVLILEFVALLDRTYARTGRMQKLIAAQLARGKQMGCTRCRLTVLEDNAPAIALYEKCGFREVDRHMDTEGFAEALTSRGYILMERDIE